MEALKMESHASAVEGNEAPVSPMATDVEEGTTMTSEEALTMNGEEETITSNGGMEAMEESEELQQHCTAVATDMNGQLEIEIPAGDTREGAIHTIQLQSPGGNTHIVEGLVVTSAGGTGEEGEATAIFHPATTGAFILPTSVTHNNNLTSTTLVSTSVSTSPTACEMITADASEHHHILSGLQVVRVASGENGETIFLVPSGAGDKETMQQVMVLQSASAEEMGEDPVHVTAQEIIEESAVEINIPSPKPILTTVKEEEEEGVIASAGDMMNDDDQSVAAAAEALQQFNHKGATTTLVVVSENTTSSATATVVTTTSTAAASANSNAPPNNPKAPSKPRASPRAPIASNGPSIADDRPKRKAAIKATATRQAALAIASPRKRSLSPKVAKSKIKVIETKSAAPAPPPPVPVVAPPPIVEVKVKGTTNSAKVVQSMNSIPVISSVSGSQGTSSSTGVIGNTGRILFGIPPPPPVVTIPSRKSSPVKVFVGGKPLQTTPPKNNLDLLPEDLVSDSDEEADGGHVRKCIVCSRKKRFTEDVFEGGHEIIASSRHQPRLLEQIEVLLSHLNIPQIRGKAHEVGMCFTCLSSLQRWHVFKCAVIKRHEDGKVPGSNFDKSPLHLDVFESRIYRNHKKMGKVKEVYSSATHTHYARRHLNDKDWDYFCQQLYRFNSSRAERAKDLERHMSCREKLSHIYCIKCQRLIRNGKKGFVKHMRTHHPHQQVLFPCDICGSHFPEKGISTEDFYTHWLSHFYFNSCDECGKRFPTKRTLGQHRQTVHKNRHSNWGDDSSNEDRPWKCDQCDASFKMKAALVSHRDVVHLNLKNHVCNICGEAFKSASSLRGHVRRHEGRRDYKCEVCDKEYYTYSALKGHKVVHQTARDFVCAICGKAFKKKKALEEHGTLHTGVKPHRCNICGREIRVKSNLYKHMKIHKKNAELGITSARGRNLGVTRSNGASSSTTATATVISTSPQQIIHDKTTIHTPSHSIPIGRIKMEPKIKQIKVEDRILEIKQEQPTIIHHFQPSSSSLSNNGATATITNPGMGTSSSPIQGATAVDVVVENADIGNGEHRAPIVVSIVTDGLSGGPASILQMDPEQQAQLLSAVTSFANSHNVSLGGGASGPTFLTSHLQAVSSGPGTNVVNTASSSGSGQDPILGVATTQFYNPQQFFTSLDQLQN